MSKDWVKDINKMQSKYGVHDWMEKATEEQKQEYLKFRAKFLEEELTELNNAIYYVDNEEVVDALIDLCVVAIGTLDAFKIDSHKAWKEVLKANMKKEVGVKKGRPNPLGLPDLKKPKDWEPPSHEGNYGILHDF
jgi:predicted HAD superfamily Cof-like phosphohydrolase